MSKKNGEFYYKMSQADYDRALQYLNELSKILARTRVVKDNSELTVTDPTAIVINDPAVSTTAKKPVKELLSDKVTLRRVVGDRLYGKIGVYNNETQILMTEKYMGSVVRWRHCDTENSQKLKELFDGQFPKFELVAQVVNWRGRDYATGSKRAIGKLLVRNKDTGKIEWWNKDDWVVVPDKFWSFADGLGQLPYYGVRDADFRAKLFKRRTKPLVSTTEMCHITATR